VSAEGIRFGRRPQGGLADRSQLGQGDPVGVARADRSGQLQGQPSLAADIWPGQGQEPGFESSRSRATKLLS